MRIIGVTLLIAAWAATASGKPSATQLNANDTANGIATTKPFTKSVVSPTSGNFRATCWDINTTQNGTFIDAWCQDGRNGLRRSYLSLGMCVVNNNGKLDPKSAGRFMESCTPCNLKSTSAILRCQCPTINNGTQDAEIELNKFVGNDWGILTCFQYIGQLLNSTSDLGGFAFSLKE